LRTRYPVGGASEPLDCQRLVTLNADALCQAHTIMECCDQTPGLSGLLEPKPSDIQLAGVRIDFTPQKKIREIHPRLRITGFCRDPEPVRRCFWVASHPGSGQVK
jgi:hypothetical protein